MVGIVIAIAGAVGGGAVPAGAGGATSAPGPLRLAVPAYWSAAEPGGAAAFDRLVAAAATVDTVVVNGPASGPADPLDPVLAAAVRRLTSAGVTVLGYVDTGYLGRTGAVTTRLNARSTLVADWRAQATADAGVWQRLYGRYGLAGIFLDQTLPACGEADEYLDAYGAIAARVWRRDSDALVVINPGAAVQECYTQVADVIVMAENAFEAYRDWTPPDWVHRHPRTMFWHLVHGVPTPEQMRETVALAQTRNAGHLYVTDAVIDGTGGPWNGLPAEAYWSAQVAAVQAIGIRCPWRP
jgi:hypothetical protein